MSTTYLLCFKNQIRRRVLRFIVVNGYGQGHPCPLLEQHGFWKKLSIVFLSTLGLELNDLEILPIFLSSKMFTWPRILVLDSKVDVGAGLTALRISCYFKSHIDLSIPSLVFLPGGLSLPIPCPGSGTTFFCG